MGTAATMPIYEIRDNALRPVTARIRLAWGLQRSGARIQAAVEQAAGAAHARGRVIRDGAFLSLPDQVILVRDRSVAASSSSRRPEMLPPAELRAAVQGAVAENFGASADEIVQSTARAVGFKATSAALREVIEAQIAALKDAGALVAQGPMIVAKEPTPDSEVVGLDERVA